MGIGHSHIDADNKPDLWLNYNEEVHTIIGNQYGKNINMENTANRMALDWKLTVASNDLLWTINYNLIIRYTQKQRQWSKGVHPDVQFFWANKLYHQ